LPLTIISEILGVPPADRNKFRRWTKTFIALTASPNVMLLGFPQLFAMMRYLRRSFRTRREHPQDDLISALVQAEEGGDQLTEDELLANVLVLLVAGHETTVNLIGTGTLALLENSDQFALLRQKPELIKNAIEELLRYVSPVEQAIQRYARENVT